MKSLILINSGLKNILIILICWVLIGIWYLYNHENHQTEYINLIPSSICATSLDGRISIVAFSSGGVIIDTSDKSNVTRFRIIKDNNYLNNNDQFSGIVITDYSGKIFDWSVLGSKYGLDDKEILSMTSKSYPVFIKHIQNHERLSMVISENIRKSQK